MLKDQRQNEILEILSKDKFATVSELAQRLYSSLPTVRRDLAALEALGYVKRCHGGATLLDGDANTPLGFRREKSAKEKIRMCRVAADMINDKAVIFLDASSTVFYISDFLSEKKEITAVTNSQPGAARFLERGVSVYSVGGRLLKESLAYVGYSAERAASFYNADIMFFSAASLSLDGEISDWSDEERGVRLAMSNNSAVKVFMCDSSKVGKSSAFELFRLSSVDYVISDAPLPSVLVEGYEMTIECREPAYLYKVGLGEP